MEDPCGESLMRIPMDNPYGGSLWRIPNEDPCGKSLMRNPMDNPCGESLWRIPAAAVRLEPAPRSSGRHHAGGRQLGAELAEELVRRHQNQPAPLAARWLFSRRKPRLSLRRGIKPTSAAAAAVSPLCLPRCAPLATSAAAAVCRLCLHRACFCRRTRSAATAHQHLC